MELYLFHHNARIYVRYQRMARWQVAHHRNGENNVYSIKWSGIILRKGRRRQAYHPAAWQWGIPQDF